MKQISGDADFLNAQSINQRANELTKLPMQHFLFIVLFLLTTSSFAQSAFELRYPHMSDYFNEMVLYNPAYAGDRSQPWIAASGRTVKRPNEVNPVSGNFFVHGLVESINSGIGLAFQYHRFDDYYTAANSTGQNLGQFPTNKELWKIGLLNNYALNTDFLDARLGVNVGLLHFQSDQVPISTQQSPVALNETYFKFNFDLGVLFVIGDFDLGLALNHVKPTQISVF